MIVLLVCMRNSSSSHFAYSLDKVIAKMVIEGMTENEAYEFYEFNQLGAWMGDLYLVGSNNVHLWTDPQKAEEGCWVLGKFYLVDTEGKEAVENFFKPKFKGYWVRGFGYAEMGDLYVVASNEVRRWIEQEKSSSGYWLLNEKI